jgi:hypothetical protein
MVVESEKLHCSENHAASLHLQQELKNSFTKSGFTKIYFLDSGLSRDSMTKNNWF